MIKVGDKVTVKKGSRMPDEYTTSQIFTIVDKHNEEYLTIDTTLLNSGWPNISLGDGSYWNIDRRYLNKVPRTILIGGELL